ncbi:MAG: hypothetical protein M0001_05460, partial [Treponema sp.]|nr:hypothetical protein [Treponema sp.]
MGSVEGAGADPAGTFRDPAGAGLGSVGAGLGAVGEGKSSSGAFRSSDRRRREAAVSAAARDFSRVDEFLQLWKPLTPWGKDDKEGRIVYRDRTTIDELLDLAEAWDALSRRLVDAGRGAVLDRKLV